MPFSRLLPTPSAVPRSGAAGARPSPESQGEASAANQINMTPEQQAWLDSMRAQTARANAAMNEIIADMRADGLLVPMRREFPKPPLFKRGPLDADYFDNAETIEAGE